VKIAMRILHHPNCLGYGMTLARKRFVGRALESQSKIWRDRVTRSSLLKLRGLAASKALGRCAARLMSRRFREILWPLIGLRRRLDFGFLIRFRAGINIAALALCFDNIV
jgi:hypothetical protein